MYYGSSNLNEVEEAQGQLGFLPLILGGVAAVATAYMQHKAQKDAEKAAKKQAKAEAKAAKEEALQRQQALIQAQAQSKAAGTPGWSWATWGLVGAGTLTAFAGLTYVGYSLSRRKPAERSTPVWSGARSAGRPMALNRRKRRKHAR